MRRLEIQTPEHDGDREEEQLLADQIEEERCHDDGHQQAEYPLVVRALGRTVKEGLGKPSAVRDPDGKHVVEDQQGVEVDDLRVLMEIEPAERVENHATERHQQVAYDTGCVDELPGIPVQRFLLTMIPRVRAAAAHDEQENQVGFHAVGLQHHRVAELIDHDGHEQDGGHESGLGAAEPAGYAIKYYPVDRSGSDSYHHTEHTSHFHQVLLGYIVTIIFLKGQIIKQVSIHQ